MEQVLDQNLNQEQALDFDSRTESLLETGYELDVSETISEAFKVFKMNIGGFIGYTLIAYGIAIGVSFIPIVGSIANSLITPALFFGFAWVTHKVIRKEPIDSFNEFFKGFEFFVPLMIAGILVSLITFLGFLLLIIPGIYLAVSYLWTSYIVVFGQKEGWPAMELSRKLISKNWWSFLGLGLLLTLINLIGALLLGVGLLVTIPVSVIAIYLTFEKIVFNTTIPEA